MNDNFTHQITTMGMMIKPTLWRECLQEPSLQNWTLSSLLSLSRPLLMCLLHNFFHSIGFELGFHYLCHRYGGVSDQLRIGCDVSQDVLVILDRKLLVQTAPSDRRARSFHHVWNSHPLSALCCDPWWVGLPQVDRFHFYKWINTTISITQAMQLFTTSNT